MSRLDQIISDLTDDDPTTRREAVVEFGDTRSTDARALPALTIYLSHELTYLRQDAAQAIGWMGPAAAPAVPTLMAVLNDDDKDVRGYAAWALGRIGANAAVAAPALAELTFKDDDPVVRGKAAVALSRTGVVSAALTDAVCAALAGYPGLAQSVSVGLSLLERDLNRGVQQLVDATEHGDIDRRRVGRLARRAAENTLSHREMMERFAGSSCFAPACSIMR